MADYQVSDVVKNYAGNDTVVSFTFSYSGSSVSHDALIEILAQLTVKGVFGSGTQRTKALGSLYSEVQRKVNTYYYNGGINR